MTVINVLYLPRDERLRSLVRLALDFVEEVYRDDVLSGLKFVSFNVGDVFDERQAWHIAKRERFEVAFYPPLFYFPHYEHQNMYVWLPVFSEETPSSIFGGTAHEVTHHAISRLSTEDRVILAEAFASDLGVEVDEMIKGRNLLPELAQDVAMIIKETVTIYIVDNYFMSLNREPEKPTHLSGIRKFAESRYGSVVRREPRYRAEILGAIYHKMAHRDLSNYRRAIHEMFTKLIKRFPADVLESNKAKYEILYREEPIP
jgi:hypothetical protein